MIYYLIIIAVIILDRAVKYAVISGMEAGQSIPVLQDIFYLSYVQNRGAAFSMWEQQWIILIALPAAVMIAGLAVLWIKRRDWSRTALLAVAFICGGGAGNLIDRIARGYVIDMLDFRLIPGLDFPVFNIADVFICVGCGLFVLDFVFLQGKREKL